MKTPDCPSNMECSIKGANKSRYSGDLDDGAAEDNQAGTVLDGLMCGECDEEESTETSAAASF